MAISLLSTEYPRFTPFLTLNLYKCLLLPVLPQVPYTNTNVTIWSEYGSGLLLYYNARSISKISVQGIFFSVVEHCFCRLNIDGLTS